VNMVTKRFPKFFHLCSPWQTISINCNLHISSTIHHNIQLISQLLTCILSYNVDVCAFFSNYSIFFVYPWVYTYPRLGITALDNTMQCILSPAEELYWALHHKSGQSVVQWPDLQQVPFELLLPYPIIINIVEHMTVHYPGNNTFLHKTTVKNT